VKGPVRTPLAAATERGEGGSGAPSQSKGGAASHPLLRPLPGLGVTPAPGSPLFF
jgi:hypothetical protein